MMNSLDDPIRTASTVAEGGTIVVEVSENVAEVHFVVPGQGSVVVQVVNGRAEYHLPPSVRGGSSILVTDGLIPNPTVKRVRVIGGLSR